MYKAREKKAEAFLISHTLRSWLLRRSDDDYSLLNNLRLMNKNVLSSHLKFFWVQLGTC